MRVREAGRDEPVTVQTINGPIQVHNHFPLDDAWTIHLAAVKGHSGQPVSFISDMGHIVYSLTHRASGYCAFHYPSPFDAATAASWLNTLPGIDWRTATLKDVAIWARGKGLYDTLSMAFGAKSAVWRDGDDATQNL